jgi:glutamine amidotransferase
MSRFVPIGDTDSEYAFCYILEALRSSFKDYPSKRTELRQAIADLGSEISRHGSFNFLLGDGRALYARCDTKLAHIVRKAPFGRATLKDEDVTVNFAEVTTPKDRVAVVATTPLTVNETWEIGEPGTLWVFEEGARVASIASRVRGPRKPHP